MTWMRASDACSHSWKTLGQFILEACVHRPWVYKIRHRPGPSSDADQPQVRRTRYRPRGGHTAFSFICMPCWMFFMENCSQMGVCLSRTHLHSINSPKIGQYAGYTRNENRARRLRISDFANVCLTCVWLVSETRSKCVWAKPSSCNRICDVRTQ